MRVNTVEKARKSPGNCDKCQTEIKVGSSYRYAQAYRGRKKVRCMKEECRFKQSDLTGSDKKARVYAAQETLEEFLSDFGKDSDLSSLQSACEDCASEIREVAQEYADAAEALGGAGEQMQEQADNLEGWADEIEEAGNQGEEFEVSYEDSEECPECGAQADHDKGRGEEGHYVCSSDKCGHEFKLDEEKNGDGQTKQEWAEEIQSAVQDALGNCPL
jgi:hypothetical protein